RRLRAGDLVVAQSSLAVLAVKLEIGPVGRVADAAAPHLLADVRVAREGENARLARLAHDANRLQRPVAAGPVSPAGMEAPVSPAHRRRVLDQVALDEEVRDAGRLDETLDSGAVA